MRIIQKIKSEVEDWVDFAENIWDILKDLWEELINFLPQRKSERSHYVPGAVRAPSFGTLTYQTSEGRTVNIPTLYSGEYAQDRMEQLGLDSAQFAEYLSRHIERQMNDYARYAAAGYTDRFRPKKKDPGAPYNKYPIVKTKFLDGYQPNKI